MIEDILGINRRNIEYVMAHNRREHFRLVDDKLLTKRLLVENGIPCPGLYATATSLFELDGFLESVARRGAFALKPARGFGGKGIAIVTDNDHRGWRLADGSLWGFDEQVEHIGAICYGVYSIDNAMDAAFAEALIEPHEGLAAFSAAGLPDIRLIIYKGAPRMAMIRAATRRSHGTANLHAGGFAVAVDLASGRTGRGWDGAAALSEHPDTGAPISGVRIPHWDRVLSIAGSLYDHFPLGYMGADFAIDKTVGPVVLELNARPGLEIQNVNGRGLRRELT
jgi:alpha-L-glutamate ligase-like protein